MGEGQTTLTRTPLMARFLPIRLKLPVKNAALPAAAMIRKTKLKAKNTFPFSSSSKSPNRTVLIPTAPIPVLRVALMPNRLRLAPMIGLTRKTTSSKTPKTRPYSEGVHPFNSASIG